ncbi:MAG TPA: hypothetical protein VH539_03240 [Gemmatimonadaceae bacterium]
MLERVLAALFPVVGDRRQTPAITGGIEAQPAIANAACQRRPTAFRVSAIGAAPVGEIEHLTRGAPIGNSSLNRLRCNIPRVPLSPV